MNVLTFLKQYYSRIIRARPASHPGNPYRTFRYTPLGSRGVQDPGTFMSLSLPYIALTELVFIEPLREHLGAPALSSTGSKKQEEQETLTQGQRASATTYHDGGRDGTRAASSDQINICIASLSAERQKRIVPTSSLATFTQPYNREWHNYPYHYTEDGACVVACFVRAIWE